MSPKHHPVHADQTTRPINLPSGNTLAPDGREPEAADPDSPLSRQRVGAVVCEVNDPHTRGDVWLRPGGGR